MRLSLADISALKPELNEYGATELFQWIHARFGSWSIASSMGAEDIALISLAATAIGPENVKVFTLDTGRLHPQTLQTVENVRNHFGVAVKVFFPLSESVEALVNEKGMYSFRNSIEDRKECCGIRKLEPLKRALGPLDAWVTGLRRDQNVTRTSIDKIEFDMMNGGLAKLNPIADWSANDVWDYIRDNDLPYNPLHDRGFPSIGCEPCTRPVKSGEDERAGRWWWEQPDSKECGLHGKE